MTECDPDLAHRRAVDSAAPTGRGEGLGKVSVLGAYGTLVYFSAR